jgi:FtsP/CotA-like multicopper oxidase with cupredoxin domain
MSELLPSMQRRTFLRGVGLSLIAAPSFSLLSSCSKFLGKTPVIDLKGNRKVLSVDALEASPDGVKRLIYTYGGQLIGPTIRVKEGERLNITILNNLKVPTIVHWHGMHQPGTWKMDGVEDVSAPAIPPGGSFTYDFEATPAGTHWYHSHAGVQYADGLFGPLIVEEATPIAKYDREEILLINDWFHESAENIWQRLSTVGMTMTGESMSSGESMGSKGDAMKSMGGGMKSDASMSKSGSSISQGASMGKNGDSMGSGASMSNMGDAMSSGSSMSMAAESKPLATKGLDQLIATQWGSSQLDWGDVPFVSGLINGKGRAPNTQSPLTEVQIKEGEVVRLRLINGSSTYSLRFQIDNHPLTVIASDGQPLKPVTVDNLLIGIGERYDVLITGKGSGSHWIRATTGQNNSIKAVLRYGENAPKEPNNPPQDWRPRFLAPSQLINPKDVNLENIAFREIPMVLGGPEPVYRWSVNGEYYPDTKPIQIKKDEWIRMRFINRTGMEHPFHMHGHSFYSLGTPDELNLKNPPLKDTLNIWPNTEQVILWKANNPGHWIFHCHAEWHMAGGMASLLYIS